MNTRAGSAGFLDPLPTERRISLGWIALPLAFLAAMLLFYSFRYVFEFDTDEGINAIKALLTLRGFRLYTEIWSDQPPAFTLLLALWLRVFGLRIVAGRILVLLFSGALVGGIVYYLRRWWGGPAALFGFIFVLLLPLYRSLSVSIMIGLPAIALAVLSFVCQVMWHDKRRPGWLALSSAFLTLSILTKAFTGILIPIWVIGIVLAMRKSNIRGAGFWSPLITWFVPLLALTSLTLLLVVGWRNVGQLIEVHLAAEGAEAFQRSDLLPGINVLLKESAWLLLLALAGIYRAYRDRLWSAFYLAAWLFTAYVLLLVNRPTWPHQQLLITIPAAVLAAIAGGAAIGDLRAHSRTRLVLAVGALTLALGFIAARGPAALREFNLRLPNLTGPTVRDLPERQLVALLADHASETTWVFTDRPMFAFQARLPVPPFLAVFSSKRLQTGELSDADILSTLEAYQPEMILRGRFDLPIVDEFMRTRNYRRIDESYHYRLYLRQGSP